MEKKSLLTIIIEFLFGTKYYANIINTRGVIRYEICCFIFRSRKSAMEHKQRLESGLSYKYIQTITFRSRKNYPESDFRNGI